MKLNFVIREFHFQTVIKIMLFITQNILTFKDQISNQLRMDPDPKRQFEYINHAGAQ